MATRTLVFLNCCRTNSIFNIVRSVHVANFTLFKQNFNKLNYNQSRYLKSYYLNFSLESNNLNHLVCFKRLKHSKKKSKGIEEDDDDDNEEERKISPELQLLLAANKNAKIVDVKVPALRIDAIVQYGAAMSRNKAELNFYEDKIRLNGDPLKKKSLQVKIDDEIDIIQGISPVNSQCLMVTRITIINANLIGTFYEVKLLLEKSLMIENYEQPWTA